MKHVLLGLMLVGAGGLVGCSSTGDTSGAGDDSLVDLKQVDETLDDDSASTSGATQGDAADTTKIGATTTPIAPVYTGHPLDNPDSPLIRKVVYFDFDQSTIKDEDKVTLNAHANYMINNPAATMRLAGHADERGTREYNVALGERRANAVYRYMTLKGVSSSQLNVVSYGEERPAKMGHDEASWAMNRRVELGYTKR